MAAIWLDEVFEVAPALGEVPQEAATTIREAVEYLLREDGADAHSARTEQKVGAIFLALASTPELNRSERFKRALASCVYVLFRDGYPSLGLLDARQKAALHSLWHTAETSAHDGPTATGNLVNAILYQVEALTS